MKTRCFFSWKRAGLLVAFVLSLPLLLVFFYAILSPRVCLLKEQNPKSSAFMELRQSEAKSRGQTLTVRQKWVSLKRMPRLLVQAVLSSEDDRFFEHDGIDWLEMRKALFGKRGPKRVRGASTISQQLVKNLYLSPQRSLLRKLKELVLTWKMERCLKKDRILECYLNLIEFGPGIFGVEAASLHYFSKSVGALSLEETLRLVAVIPRPLTSSPRSDGSYLKWRIRWIAERLVQKRLISPEDTAPFIGNRIQRKP